MPQILTYRHPKVGNRVDLLGVVHVQSPQFFRNVGAFLASRVAEGAVVHYEGVRQNTPEEIAQAPRTDRYKMRLLAPLADYAEGQVARSSDPQRVLQEDSWLPAGAENHDVSQLDIAERIPFKRALIISALVQAVPLVTKEKQLNESLEAAVQAQPAASDEAQPPSGFQSPLLQELNEVFIDYRNEVALDAFDTLQAQRPGTDACLVWGDDHLPGLASGLRSRGYQPFAHPMQH